MKHFLEEPDEPLLEPDIAIADGLTRRDFLISLGALWGAGVLGLAPEPAEAAPALEDKIETYIKGLRKKGIVHPSERTAWSVYDFATGKKLVSINEDLPYQSASMIKPFVALAFFYKVREGRLHYTRKSRAMMESMIQKSNNRATNYFIDMLGYRNGRVRPREVERILKRYAPGVFRQTRIVERIPRGGRSYRNKASAHDYSRFLYALWHDQFPYSREIKRLMSLPNRDRIRARRLPYGIRVYDKTGTTARLCGNMGIIAARGRNGRTYPYTFIGIIERSRRTSNYTLWSRRRGNVIREVSGIVYDDLRRRHRLA